MDNDRLVNPALDLSQHYIPLELAELFGNEGECALEIGFGDGDFLIETAVASPDRNFLGVEVKKRRFNKAVKKAVRAGTANVKFLHMDANIAIQDLFHPGAFSLAYINFPDPWPKDRHEKHRIINRNFLSRLSGIIKPGGHLDIASDHKDYIVNALGVLGTMDQFKSAYPEPGYVNSIPGRPVTRYEREFREEGREIYYIMFTNCK